jgi:glycerol-3-phosphate dehydrogenase
VVGVELGGALKNVIALAAGIEPFFSRYIKLGVEVQAGLRHAGDKDRAFLGAAFTLGLGW